MQKKKLCYDNFEDCKKKEPHIAQNYTSNNDSGVGTVVSDDVQIRHGRLEMGKESNGIGAALSYKRKITVGLI